MISALISSSSDASGRPSQALLTPDLRGVSVLGGSLLAGGSMPSRSQLATL